MAKKLLMVRVKSGFMYLLVLAASCLHLCAAFGRWGHFKTYLASPQLLAFERQLHLQVAHSLEADPYWDHSKLPIRLYKVKEPHVGKIISVNKIVSGPATGEICHIVIDHFGKMPYLEGQSCAIIPPGINPKTGKPHHNRLYSVASSRYGDDMSGTKTALCVRRVTFHDSDTVINDTGKGDLARKGICSNFLCDAQPGDEVMMAGPVGKVMALPESQPNADIIMIATGTGVAPFRSFLRRLFFEDNPAARHFKGLAWLFLGVSHSDALLYRDDWRYLQEHFPAKFRLNCAFSREEINPKTGGKMYIQDKVEEHGQEIFDRMQRGAHLYLCGLKGMVPDILRKLEGIAEEQGLIWADVLKHWKEQGRWHVEVY